MDGFLPIKKKQTIKIKPNLCPKCFYNAVYSIPDTQRYINNLKSIICIGHDVKTCEESAFDQVSKECKGRFIN